MRKGDDAQGGNGDVPEDALNFAQNCEELRPLLGGFLLPFSDINQVHLPLN
jgi:hypothetical protein